MNKLTTIFCASILLVCIMFLSKADSSTSGNRKFDKNVTIAGTVTVNTLTPCDTCHITPVGIALSGVMIPLQCVPCSEDSGMWKVNGNNIADSTKNFIGTKNAMPFIGKTNDIERFRITSNGKMGIGTNTPDRVLDVECSGCAAGSVFKMVDGSQSLNYILTSDGSGNASWQPGEDSVIVDTLVTSGHHILNLQVGITYIIKGSTGSVDSLNFPAATKGHIHITISGSIHPSVAIIGTGTSNTSLPVAPSGGTATTTDYVCVKGNWYP